MHLLHFFSQIYTNEAILSIGYAFLQLEMTTHSIGNVRL